MIPSYRKIIQHVWKRSLQIYIRNKFHKKLKKCDILIDKRINKYLINIKPTAAKLSALIRIHIGNEPIRPAVNNTQAPFYKIAQILNNSLNDLINLPYIYIFIYTTKNPYEIAQELNNIQISKRNWTITLDLKDLFVNLAVQNILHITKFWLNKHNNINTITEPNLYLLK